MTSAAGTLDRVPLEEIRVRGPVRTVRLARLAEGRWRVEHADRGWVTVEILPRERGWAIATDTRTLIIEGDLRPALEAVPPWDVGWTEGVSAHIARREPALFRPVFDDAGLV